MRWQMSKPFKAGISYGLARQLFVFVIRRMRDDGNVKRSSDNDTVAILTRDGAQPFLRVLFTLESLV